MLLRYRKRKTQFCLSKLVCITFILITKQYRLDADISKRFLKFINVLISHDFLNNQDQKYFLLYVKA